MTTWTDLPPDQQITALRMVVGALTGHMTEDELRAKARLWRTWGLGELGERMAAVLEYMADARHALERAS